MELLNNIPVSLELEKVLKGLRLRNVSKYVEGTVQELIETVRTIAKPKAIYEVSYVDNKTEDSLYIGGVKFTSHVLSVNLEKVDDCNLFRQVLRLPDLVQLLQLHSGKKLAPGETILVIDEIQNSEIAMTQLRYFYEEMPTLHVLAAGSLLDVKLAREGFSFPVGRVEYCYMHPVSFDEYLDAIQDEETFQFLSAIEIQAPLPDATHEL